MADKGSLSDKERAIIEAARRELAAKAAPGAAPAAAAVPAATPAPRSNAPAEPAQPAAQPPIPAPAADMATKHAVRIAALMAAEREETARRRQTVRRWGHLLPARPVRSRSAMARGASIAIVGEGRN